MAEEKWLRVVVSPDIRHATGVSLSTISRIKRGMSYPAPSPQGA